MHTKTNAWDALRVFTVLYAHCLALQVAKDVRTFGGTHSPQLLLTLPLAVTIAACHFSTSATTLVGLALSALVVLCAHGSQSNHIILELAATVAVLLTAPMPVWSRGKLVCEDERRAWMGRLTASLRAILVVLYGVAAFAKLNRGWFDVRYSCCVQMTVSILGRFSPTSPLALSLFAPMALAFEALMPAALVGAALTEARRLGGTGRLIFRGCVVLGGAFHVVIALPPPPMSVYPFSMLMAPLYVALLPEEVESAALAIARASRLSLVTGGAGLTAVTAAVSHAASRSTHFEYPPYFSYELGVLWVMLAFGALAIVGLCVPTPRPSSAPVLMSRPRKLLTLLPAAVLLAVGAAPYLGVRSHPAFAMFSNLRIEGARSRSRTRTCMRMCRRRPTRRI